MQAALPSLGIVDLKMVPEAGSIQKEMVKTIRHNPMSNWKPVRPKVLNIHLCGALIASQVLGVRAQGEVLGENSFFAIFLLGLVSLCLGILWVLLQLLRMMRRCYRGMRSLQQPEGEPEPSGEDECETLAACGIGDTSQRSSPGKQRGHCTANPEKKAKVATLPAAVQNVLHSQWKESSHLQELCSSKDDPRLHDRRA